MRSFVPRLSCLCGFVPPLLVGIVALAPVATAQLGRPAPVAVTVDACVPVQRDTFDRLLQLELGASSDVAKGEEGTVTQVAIACEAGGIALTVIDPLTRKTMHRTLDRLSGVGAERLLALAVAEFVVASWVELSLQPEPAVEPVGVAPPANAVEAAQARVAANNVESPPGAVTPDDAPPDVRIGASLGWLAVVGSRGPSWLGGRLLLDVHLVDRLYLEIHGEAIFGEHKGSLGVVNSSLLGGRAILSYGVKASPSLGLSLGVGFQLGRLQYSSVAPNDTAYLGLSGSARIGGPLLSTRLGIATGSDSDVGLRLSLGMLSLPVELSAERSGVVIDASGTWVCIALDVMTSL